MGASRDAVPNPKSRRGDVRIEDIATPLLGGAADALAGRDVEEDTGFRASAALSNLVGEDPEDEIDAGVERLKRLDADAEMVALVRASGAQSPEWWCLAEQLLKYGTSTMEALVCSRRIYEQFRRLGAHPQVQERDQRRLAEDTFYRQDLIDDAVFQALHKLGQEILAGTGWNPAGGSLLATYFVNKCVLAFADVLRKNLKPDRRHYEFPRCGAEIGLDLGLSPGQRRMAMFADPELTAMNNDVLRQHFKALDTDEDRAVVLYKAHRYTEAEIAEILGRTRKSIERRWARLRSSHAWINNLSISSVRNPS